MPLGHVAPDPSNLPLKNTPRGLTNLLGRGGLDQVLQDPVFWGRTWHGKGCIHGRSRKWAEFLHCVRRTLGDLHPAPRQIGLPGLTHCLIIEIINRNLAQYGSVFPSFDKPLSSLGPSIRWFSKQCRTYP